MRAGWGCRHLTRHRSDATGQPARSPRARATRTSKGPRAMTMAMTRHDDTHLQEKVARQQARLPGLGARPGDRTRRGLIVVREGR